MEGAPRYAVSDRPRIALVVTPFNDANLRLAAQIGAEDIVYYNSK